MGDGEWWLVENRDCEGGTLGEGGLFLLFIWLVGRSLGLIDVD